MNIFDNVNSIERIGQISNKLDIIYKMNNEDKFRGLQVKTLTKYKDSNRFALNIRDYEDDTLIVGINKEKNKFVIFFHKQIKKGVRSFTFNNSETKYKKFSYTNTFQFLEQLQKLLSRSTVYDPKKGISRNNLMEQESSKRLKNKCDQLNYHFKWNETNSMSIDCFINYYNIQCKTSNSIRKYKEKLYCFNVLRTGGRLNGKITFRPYSEFDNIDFFIFEIIDFKDNFYVIPMNEMINHGIIQTKDQQGKKQLYLPPPSYQKPHWTKKYLNNFIQLKPFIKN